MQPSLLAIYSASAFTITFLFMPVLIKLLSQWRVFDSPGKHKIHNQYTPSMGGICILLGAAFAQLIGLRLTDWGQLKYFYICIAIMFITGLRDDILTLSPRQKLLGQILPVIILVVFGDTVLWSFYNLDVAVSFPGPVAWFLTIFTIVILTNAYNLIDGLDGLAGTIGLIALTCFGTWFSLIGDPRLSLISFSFAAAVAAFLWFNWEPSRIFMGDTGALVLGVLLSFLTIQFINANFALPADSALRFNGSIGTAVMVMIIPIFDTLRVIVIRISRLQSPFRADKNHFHHQFLKMGFSHAKTVGAIASFQLFFVVLALVLKNSPDTVILPVAAVACVIMHFGLRVFQKRHERNGGKSLITEN